jgi:Coproporphyrinogen III oxidase and related Fe-S oxidoreductases
MQIEDLFANIGDNPLTDAFTIEKKKTLPSIDKSKKMPAMPSWEGGRFEDFAREAYTASAGRPLALYLHVPFCHHRCTFCPFYINKTYDTFSGHYTSLLSKDIDITAKILQGVIKERSVQTVYFGGGTPSDMEADDLAQIIRQLHDTFNIASDAEITVEGRVSGFTADKGKAWTQAGANRFSIGVQTTDTRLRKKLSRQSDRAQIAATLNGLCESGSAVVVDLMYGLPGQTPEMLVDDIRFLAEETGIHGLDLYELRVFPDSALDKAIIKGSMPPVADVLEQARMFGAAHAKLLSYGFENFSAKHWRRDPKEHSIYNTLAKKQTDMIPFGSGGGGRIGNISLGVTGNIGEYEEMIGAGMKPTKRIMKSPLLPQSGFIHELNNAFEKLRMPAPEQWPQHLRTQGEKLAAQWRDSGLLSTNKDELGLPLTCAGTFWGARMNKMLADFVNTSV